MENNNNFLQNELLNESELTELINEFYNYYGNLSNIQPQATGIQSQSSSLNNDSNNGDDVNITCDDINDLFVLDDDEYLPFDCFLPMSDQNFQQSPIMPNEHFTSNFTSTSNNCLPQSIPTQSIPSDNFSYTFNTVTVDSLQTS